MPNILILGGGAAGLAAALAAAQSAPAAQVIVLERNPKPGKKLLATGNGRCNLDNTGIAPELYFTAAPAALRPLLDAVNTADPLRWFRALGLYTRTDEAGRAVHFVQAEDGKHYYHGWVDMRANMVGSGASKATGAVSLYLGDTLAPEGADPELLKATRVGLKLSRNGEVVQSRYFTLDDTAGSHRAEHPATAPTGLSGYTEGMLLGWKNGALACANDNAQNFASYMMQGGENATRPQNTLLTMDLGTTYRLDVYYYIEGTDLDSADYLYNDTGILHVNLFAVLDGQGA